MKITKQRLKEIIREELNLGDLQSTDRFTGGSPEERLLTLMKARELLAAMGKEELAALSKSLDAETVAALRHLLANPMYKEGDEMELEEYRGEPERKKPAPRPSSDTRSSNSGYRSGAAGKKNQGRGGY